MCPGILVKDLVQDLDGSRSIASEMALASEPVADPAINVKIH